MFSKLKKLNKRIIISMFMVVFALGSLCACSNSTKNPSVKDIEEKITKSIDISDMKSSDNNKLEKLYKISNDDVEEFCLYSPASNIKSSEIAIIKVKDKNKVDEIKTKIQKHIEEQGSNFKDYLPEQYYLIEKHVLKTNGNYILLSISKDTDKVEKIFDESFK